MNIHGARKFSYPQRSGNRFELLIDGNRFFPAMMEDIAAATETILLELYLFESGTLASQMIELLCDAAERGVAIFLLLDDFGARKLQRSDRERLQEKCTLRFYNPLHYGKYRRNLFRDHRKLLLIDTKVAYTGGTGITDYFDPGLDKNYWHEVMVRIEGPVVDDWHDLFTQNWQRHGDQLPYALPTAATQSGHQLGRVTVARPTRQEIKRSAINHIRHARERVWLSTAYFVPPWKIRRALRYAADSDCDVRLLLPGPKTDHPSVRHAGRRFFSRLLHSGVRIFEYQPRFLHTKLMLSDDWVSVGSSNIDRWNLRWNLEANQEVEDGEFSQKVTELFEQDFAQSVEITLEQWQQRSRFNRLQEWFWGMIDTWLDRTSLSRLRRRRRD